MRSAIKLVAATALFVLLLPGCSYTEFSSEPGKVVKLTSYRLFVSTAASIDVTDPEAGLSISGSYSSDPQAQQAQEALSIAARALQLAAPGVVP